VDNCADAIVLAGIKPNIEGETFNVVDDNLPTSREFLTSIKEVKRFRSIRIPYVVAYAASAAWERYSTWSKGQLPPVFNRRRCAADWKSHQYSNKKLKDRVGWKPRVRMNDALKAFLAQFSAESSNN
jgi:nucleoside-diphosphate-sugar epimerase